MELNAEIKSYLDRSVLCWLATASSDGQPNVSPKEIFTYFKDKVIIANIASPQTVKNILKNNKVCLSFIDILVQKGYQLKGEARILRKSDEEFAARAALLLPMTAGRFPFASITEITVDSAKPILAPSYVFYADDTNEAQQIANAKKTYGL